MALSRAARVAGQQPSTLSGPVVSKKLVHGVHASTFALPRSHLSPFFQLWTSANFDSSGGGLYHFWKESARFAMFARM